MALQDFYYGEVVGGDFKGCRIDNNNQCLYIKNYPSYEFIPSKMKYQIMQQDSGIQIGLFPKNKFEIQIAVYWIDGKKSLIKLYKRQYQKFLETNF